MGFRFRKSINLGGGARLNLGKRGIGLSAGVRGARVSANTSGRRSARLGVPGTGVGYEVTSGGGRRRSAGGESGLSSWTRPRLWVVLVYVIVGCLAWAYYSSR